MLDRDAQPGAAIFSDTAAAASFVMMPSRDITIGCAGCDVADLS
jgi:hypothetical protein